MSLVGPGGRWVHVSQLRKGDRISFWPNLFDFIFLDTVSRRFDVHLAEDGDRRDHPIMGLKHSPRPYLLERIPDFRKFWKLICGLPNISETKLEGVTTLLARKCKSWASDDGGEVEVYRWLVEETVKQQLNGSRELEGAIQEGLFFDVVELFRRILKEKVEAPKAEQISEEVRG